MDDVQIWYVCQSMDTGSIYTKRFVGQEIEESWFSDLIGLTDYTVKQAGGSLNSYTIYPGKDNFEDIKSDDAMVVKMD